MPKKETTTSISEPLNEQTGMNMEVVVNYLSGVKFLLTRLILSGFSNLRKYSVKPDRDGHGKDSYEWIMGANAPILFSDCCEFIGLDEKILRGKAKSIWLRHGKEYPKTVVDKWVSFRKCSLMCKFNPSDWFNFFVKNRIRYCRFGKSIRVRFSDILLYKRKVVKRKAFPDLFQSVFYLRVDGFSRETIAKKLGVSDRMVFSIYVCLGIDHE